MSPVLEIISLQWEGRDVYNFSISNCVVSLHADRNLSIISSLLLISPASDCIFLFTESHIFTMILRTSLRYACFLRGIQSLDNILHLISSKYQIIDPSLS